jgi:co-chaperonin GroES (HSP10)
MNIKALDERVVVLPDPPKTTSGSLLIPTDQLKRMQIGTVVSIGKHDLDPEFKVGARVVFADMIGVPMDFEGETYLMAKVIEIFGIVEE